MGAGTPVRDGDKVQPGTDTTAASPVPILLGW